LAIWGYAAVTAAARMNANIKRGNRIGLPAVLEPSLHSGHNVTVVIASGNSLDAESFGMFQLGSTIYGRPASGQPDGRRSRVLPAINFPVPYQ
jgi:hypothetical protein